MFFMKHNLLQYSWKGPNQLSNGGLLNKKPIFSLRPNPGERKTPKKLLLLTDLFSNSLFSKTTGLNSSIKSSVDSSLLKDYSIERS